MSHLTLKCNSWRHHNGLRTQNFNFAYYDVSIFLENWLYLSKNWLIFFKILICSSWDNSQQGPVVTIFHFDQRHHGVFLRLKEHISEIFSHFACYSLWDRWLFLKTWFYIPVFREQYLRRVSFIYAELSNML